MAHLSEIMSDQDLGELMEEIEGGTSNLTQPEVDQVRALYELTQLLEVQVNCQLVMERARPGYLYQAAGVPREEIESRLLITQAFPGLVVQELEDGNQQFLVTAFNGPEVSRWGLGAVLGFYENYEGPFGMDLGKFVSYKLTYPLRYIDDSVVKKLRVQLFGYFVRTEVLETSRFWRYLSRQNRTMLEFTQRYGYEIDLRLDGEKLLLSEVNRRLKLYTKFPDRTEDKEL